MNIVTFNVRGCCSSGKRQRISQIIQRGNADICMIQETKCNKMEAGNVNNMWSIVDKDWLAQNSVGNSGGILSMWNTTRISAFSSFSGKGFLGLHLAWNNHNLVIINVYAPCDPADKRRLWRDLINIKNNYPDVGWIVGGDFNSVKNGEERKGLSGNNSRDMKEFNEFIEEFNV
ncbi:unnamed protein product [Lathyrus sativus]|nr:unnamed protein product [Lathyrus sativus]